VKHVDRKLPSKIRQNGPPIEDLGQLMITRGNPSNIPRVRENVNFLEETRSRRNNPPYEKKKKKSNPSKIPKKNQPGGYQRADGGQDTGLPNLRGLGNGKQTESETREHVGGGLRSGGRIVGWGEINDAVFWEKKTDFTEP